MDFERLKEPLLSRRAFLRRMARFAVWAMLPILVAAGVPFAPIFHRFLHRFHLDLDKT
jgi:hypothetical protein